MGTIWTQTNPNDLEQESWYQMPLHARQVRWLIPMKGAGQIPRSYPQRAAAAQLQTTIIHPAMQVCDGQNFQVFKKKKPDIQHFI